MTYTVPDQSTFEALFPAFAGTAAAAYDFWAARAGRIIDPMQSCLGDDADLAAMLATAHYLTLQGLGTGAEAEAASGGMLGYKSISSGQLSLERFDSADANTTEWASTSYGARVWPMLRACVAGARVTGTGVLPCVRGRYPHGFA